MSGIVFFATNNLVRLEDFYSNLIGCEIWLKQTDCTIFKNGNLLLGFCQREDAETKGTICFYFEDRSEVDDYYSRLRDIADSPPEYNEKYRIYHFYAHDPENRKVEFQTFEHEL